MNNIARATLTFERLVKAIRHVHDETASQASKAVNLALTLRNWAIGLYIHEYEQNGLDRAQYGERLLDQLAQRLQAGGLQRIEPRELRRYRQFYQCYPQIWESVTPKFRHLLPAGETPTAPRKRESVTPELRHSGQDIVTRLSFTHLAELIAIDDPLKRVFYETECMRGNWSVRELERQIHSLYYERSGLSKNKRKLSQLVQSKTEAAEPKLAIRDPYIFEFLGIRSREVMSESDLEDALLDKLQEFLLELGHGFCFEARQKRILIGDTHGFVDLVFYHRILKCHVLVELKIEEFTHENLGQLNTYISWYRRHMMTEGDNPPVGILLCAQRDHALVEYALAGMDNRLFVSKYQLELPKRQEMQQFIEDQIREAAATNPPKQQQRARRKRK